MLSFLYVYSDHSILECYNLFSGVELSMRSFFVISVSSNGWFDAERRQIDSWTDSTSMVHGPFCMRRSPIIIYATFKNRSPSIDFYLLPL